MSPALSNTMLKPMVNIHIGGCFASEEPTVVTTVLGSCISACIYDAGRGIGGMNHIMLPGKADLKNYNNPARFGVNAMELLINRLMKLGAGRYDLRAKVFGGAQVISRLTPENQLGLRNAEFVIDYLENENIKIVNSNVGGSDSRKIFFHTDTGDVFLKRLCGDATALQRAQQETELLKKIKARLKSPGRLYYLE
jgi:chemotaxis protein CheD